MVMESTGCHTRALSPDSRELEKMHSFQKDLSTGVFFCASCAGIKDDFHRLPEMSKTMTYGDDLQAELEKLKCSDLETLKTIFGRDADGEKFGKNGSTHLHFDLAFIFCPLSGSEVRS